jgi:hypothetical protein
VGIGGGAHPLDADRRASGNDEGARSPAPPRASFVSSWDQQVLLIVPPGPVTVAVQLPSV